MGKREKKQRRQRHPRREASHYLDEEREGGFGSDCFSAAAPRPSLSDDEPEEEEVDEEEDELGNGQNPPSSSADIPSKFQLYQQSVQVLPFLDFGHFAPFGSKVGVLFLAEIQCISLLLGEVAERRH